MTTSFKNLIDERQVSYYRLAKDTGISKGALSRLINGQSKPENMTLGSAVKIVEYLDMDISEFVKELGISYEKS